MTVIISPKKIKIKEQKYEKKTNKYNLTHRAIIQQTLNLKSAVLQWKLHMSDGQCTLKKIIFIIYTWQSKSKMCHYCSLFHRVMDLGIQLNPWLEYCVIHFVHAKIHYAYSIKLKNNYKTLQETKVNCGSITMGLLKKVPNFGEWGH